MSKKFLNISRVPYQAKQNKLSCPKIKKFSMKWLNKKYKNYLKKNRESEKKKIGVSLLI